MYLKPRTSQARKEHKVYPYLLRGVRIEQVHHVWSTDLTYVPIRGGWMYLMAVIDWYSRYVIAWDITNSMEAELCCEVLNAALDTGKPRIFNTDQGGQFTSPLFTSMLSCRSFSLQLLGATSHGFQYL